MALQNAAAINTVLGARFFTRSAQVATGSYLEALNTTTTDGFASIENSATGLLNRKLNLLTTISSADQLQKGLQDTITSVLQDVEDDLQQIQTLIDDTISTPANASSNQSQIETIVQTIASTIGSALGDDPFTRARVLIENSQTDIAYSDAQVFRLTSFIDEDDGYNEIDLNVLDTGSRSRISGALDTTNGTAGQFDNNLQFEVSGTNGTSGTINITSGDTVATVVQAINDLAGTTGVYAEVNSGDSNQIDLYADDYGDHTITITDLDTGSDTQSEITDFSSDNSGTDASLGSITLSPSGDIYRETTHDGRTMTFSGLEGVEGEVLIAKDDGVVSESANPTGEYIRVFNGGRQIIGDGGELLFQLSTRNVNFNTLGSNEGGLNAIDVSNDVYQAERIIDEALGQIAVAIDDSQFIADTFLSDRISSATTRIDDLDTNITEIGTFFDALRVADTVLAEAQATSALNTLSTLSNIFPTATTSLL